MGLDFDGSLYLCLGLSGGALLEGLVTGRQGACVQHLVCCDDLPYQRLQLFDRLLLAWGLPNLSVSFVIGLRYARSSYLCQLSPLPIHNQGPFNPPFQHTNLRVPHPGGSQPVDWHWDYHRLVVQQLLDHPKRHSLCLHFDRLHKGDKIHLPQDVPICLLHHHSL